MLPAYPPRRRDCRSWSFGGLGAEAFPEHLLQGCRPPVLLQQVAKRLIRELLDGLHPILRQPVERVPGGRVEGNSATNSSGATLCHHFRLARFFAGAASVPRLLPGFAALGGSPPPASMLRRSASIRFTTLAGRATGFSFGAGSPACLERMSSIIAFSYRSSNFSGSNSPVILSMMVSASPIIWSGSFISGISSKTASSLRIS